MNQAYLLLDRARISHLPEQLIELGGTTYHSLYQATAYSALEEVGPLLVPVAPGSSLAQKFSSAWSATCGVWLESDAGEALLLEHLRSLVHAGCPLSARCRARPAAGTRPAAAVQAGPSRVPRAAPWPRRA